MTHVLKTIDNFESLVQTYRTKTTQVFIVGHIDKPHYLGEVNDLVFYVGAPANIYNWGKYMLISLQQWLLAKRINVKHYQNQLLVSDTIVLTYTEHMSESYSYSTVIVKIPDGLNQYGITGDEVYEVLNTVVNHYNSAVINKEGDS